MRAEIRPLTMPSKPRRSAYRTSPRSSRKCCAVSPGGCWTRTIMMSFVALIPPVCIWDFVDASRIGGKYGEGLPGSGRKASPSYGLRVGDVRILSPSPAITTAGVATSPPAR